MSIQKDRKLLDEVRGWLRLNHYSIFLRPKMAFKGIAVITGQEVYPFRRFKSEPLG